MQRALKDAQKLLLYDSTSDDVDIEIQQNPMPMVNPVSLALIDSFLVILEKCRISKERGAGVAVEMCRNIKSRALLLKKKKNNLQQAVD